MDEITLTHVGWAWEVQNLFFFAISGSSKIDRTHKHSNTCQELNFHWKVIFLKNARNMSSIRINNNWNYQNTLITATPFRLTLYAFNQHLWASNPARLSVHSLHDLCELPFAQTLSSTWVYSAAGIQLVVFQDIVNVAKQIRMVK